MAKAEYGRWKGKGGRPKKAREIKSLVQLLNELSQLTGSNEKIEFLRKHKKREDLQKVLRLALDPFIRFHVKVPYDIPSLMTDQRFRFSDSHLKSFFELADMLASKKIKGSDARSRVHAFLKVCPAESSRWYTRIINKNLQLGIQRTTVNKIWPGLLTGFDIQLCASLKEEKVRSKVERCIKQTGFIWGETKFDGERVVFLFPEGEPSLALSRAGHELPGLRYLAKALRPYFEGCAVDGEAFGTNWNQSITLARATDTTLKSLKMRDAVLHFYAFDVVPYEDFMNQSGSETVENRRRELTRRLRRVKSPYIHQVERFKIKSWGEAQSLATESVRQGYEGIVFKVPESLYSFKRSDAWMRLKLFKSIDVPIVAVKKGKPGKKYAKTCGRIIIEYKGKRFGVGTGLSDEQRKNFWRRRREIIGKIVEIKVQEESTFEGLLRPPLVFRRFRLDKESTR